MSRPVQVGDWIYLDQQVHTIVGLDEDIIHLENGQSLYPFQGEYILGIIPSELRFAEPHKAEQALTGIPELDLMIIATSSIQSLSESAVSG